MQFQDKKPDETITQMYFYNEPTYNIIIFVEGSSGSFSIDFNESLHNDILNDKSAIFDKMSNGAMFIDREWAISLLGCQQDESEGTE